jgi:hypothetical protein
VSGTPPVEVRIKPPANEWTGQRSLLENKVDEREQKHVLILIESNKGLPIPVFFIPSLTSYSFHVYAYSINAEKNTISTQMASTLNPLAMFVIVQ